MRAWLIHFFCGMGAAVLSAWGVGGGTLLLLVMTLFLGFSPQEAQGVNLLFFLPTASAALWQHRKNGYLDGPVWRRTVPWAIPAALLSAWFSASADTSLLRRPFGVFLLLSAAALLWPSGKQGHGRS